MGKMHGGEVEWVAELVAEEERKKSMVEAQAAHTPKSSERVLTPEEKAQKAEAALEEQQAILELETQKTALEAEIASDNEKRSAALGKIVGFIGVMSKTGNSAETEADIIERRKEAEAFAKQLEERIAKNTETIAAMNLDARKARYRTAFPDGPSLDNQQ